MFSCLLGSRDATIQRGAVLFPDPGPDAIGRLAFAGRTAGVNGNHHIDNIEVTQELDSLGIAVDLRVGGGSDRRADGFSLNFARPNDPVFSEEGGGIGEGWAKLEIHAENIGEGWSNAFFTISYKGNEVFNSPLCCPPELAPNWQNVSMPVPGQSLPEPAAATLAIFALAAVTCLRRRTRGTQTVFSLQHSVRHDIQTTSVRRCLVFPRPLSLGRLISTRRQSHSVVHVAATSRLTNRVER